MPAKQTGTRLRQYSKDDTQIRRLSLDHVALVAADLDNAQSIYARMGFNLSPRSSHQGLLQPGGQVELWGTGNHCAMFRHGYLEILGITDKQRYCEQVQKLLNKYAGLHLIALGTADIEWQARELRKSIGKKSTTYEVSRDVPLVSGGTGMATFSILEPPSDMFPEADIFFIEHKNRDFLWQPELLAQPNGVVALSDVIICSDTLRDTVDRLSIMLDIVPAIKDGSCDFSLAAGRITVIEPGAFARKFPGVVPTEIPWVGAVTFLVRNINETSRYLRENSFDLHQLAETTVWIAAVDAAGVVIIFSE